MHKTLGLFASILCVASPVTAKPYVNAKGHTAKHHAKEAELKHGIPENLLLAIAHYESNKSPYAINARGRGYFFKTKEQAVDFIDKLVKEGCKNINIGFMQLNYASHRKRFKSAADMIDPEKNIMYAAKLLVALKRTHGSWERAVEAYKGSFSETSQNYRTKVFSLRFKLPKISLKKEQKPIQNVAFKKTKPQAKYCVTSTQSEFTQGPLNKGDFKPLSSSFKI